MWTMFKVFIKFVTIVLLFYVCVCVYIYIYVCVCIYIYIYKICEACGILAPQPGIKPVPPALESKDVTTKLLGKSHPCILEDHLWL